MSYDELELDMLGERRTAMFVIISDTDDTFNFVVAIMYTQLFNLLCDKADDEHGGRLPYHVRLLLDEFANIGSIPKFDKLIATIRSREISASIILQSQSQLKTIYKDAAETITGNCDTMLYLYTSVAPIPFATMSNREWGQMGTNYFRGLFALAFQAFLMMVCVGIYAALVASIELTDNVHSALFGVAAYTIILCFSLLKTGSLSKQIFNTH